MEESTVSSPSGVRENEFGALYSRQKATGGQYYDVRHSNTSVLYNSDQPQRVTFHTCNKVTL